ncbi:MAG: hypothetical protein IKN17_01295 [Ruminococcus sp.]|nr:hypothetical protein [Ruminococcus sp.]
MSSDEKRELAISMLVEKQAALGRLPKRSDFAPDEVCFIKQKLGPFPRALEQAGLKEAAGVPAAVRSRQKRRRAALRRKLSKNDPALTGKKTEEEI